MEKETHPAGYQEVAPLGKYGQGMKSSRGNPRVVRFQSRDFVYAAAVQLIDPSFCPMLFVLWKHRYYSHLAEIQEPSVSLVPFAINSKCQILS